MVEREHDCTFYEELASAARDDALAPEEREALDAHLLVCTPCCDLADGFELVDAALHDEAPAASAALHERVFAAIERPGAARARPRPLAHAAHLAAAALLIVVALAIVDPGEQTDAVGADFSLGTIAELQRRALDDQALLIETMQWELRALRLEVRTLEDDDTAPVLDRIDRLLTHTKTAPWHPHRPEDGNGEDR